MIYVLFMKASPGDSSNSARSTTHSRAFSTGSTPQC